MNVRRFAVSAAMLAVVVSAPSVAAEAGKAAKPSKAASSKQIERGRYMIVTGHCTIAIKNNRPGMPKR